MSQNLLRNAAIRWAMSGPARALRRAKIFPGFEGVASLPSGESLIRQFDSLLKRIAEDASLDEDTRALALDKTKAVAEGIAKVQELPTTLRRALLDAKSWFGATASWVGGALGEIVKSEAAQKTLGTVTEAATKAAIAPFVASDMPSGASRYLIGDVGAGATVLQGEHLSVGFTAEQVRMLIEAATRGADEKVAEVSRRLGVTQGAMRTMLATLGQAEVPEERLAEKLAEVFQHYRKAAAAIAALDPENPVAQEHAAKASQAAASGDRNEARRHLQAARAAAEAAAAEARRLAREAEAAAEKQMLQAARAVAAEAELALTALEYAEAAQLFGEAALLVPSGEPNEKGILLRRQADAMQREGEERGDNTVLQEAIPLYSRALELLPRDRVPLYWATTQNNLGSALATLGERESGTARLDEAVAAYRAALEERTRHHVPLQWAMTQSNLGTALWRLGERESGTTRLEEAVVAFRAALEETKREQAPRDWAMTQVNLGCAVSMLGARESGTARLKEAVAAFRAALEETPRDRVPRDWAMTQVNLGSALSMLSARESGTVHLEEAVAAFRAALGGDAAQSGAATMGDDAG